MAVITQTRFAFAMSNVSNKILGLSSRVAQRKRDGLMVSNSRCGLDKPGSNPGLSNFLFHLVGVETNLT